MGPSSSGHRADGELADESVDDMQLVAGKPAYAIIKATSVMVGVD